MVRHTAQGGARAGLTLVELLVAVAIMALLATAVTGLVSGGLHAHEQVLTRSRLNREGLQVMDRITASIRTATLVSVPNPHQPVRTMLVLSGAVNDDQDFYFDDPLFPRIDEDPHDDMNVDNASGVRGVDDDGDGSVDEGGDHDDDEDGVDHEDPLDGKDNDGDGSIDEDLDKDAQRDGKPGIAGMDDDGDGLVDEGDNDDDDEDGFKDEDPFNERIYALRERELIEADHPLGGVRTLATQVSAFRVTWLGPDLFYVELMIEEDGGHSAAFAEWVCARNVRQQTGKRVR